MLSRSRQRRERVIGQVRTDLPLGNESNESSLYFIKFLQELYEDDIGKPENRIVNF